MSGPLHRSQQPDDGIHTPIAWTFTNAATRTAFTPASGLPVTSGELTADDLNRFALQLDDGSIWRLTAVTPTWVQVTGSGITPADSRYIVLCFGSTGGSVTNAYMRRMIDFSNQNPYRLPFAVEIIALAASRRGATGTWTAEVHDPTTLIVGATITTTGGTQTAHSVLGSPIALSAGDEISGFCSGSAINRPQLDVYMRRT